MLYNSKAVARWAMLGNGVTAAPTTLTRIVKVQILVPQPFLPPLSSGLGRGPLKAETPVRIRSGVPHFRRRSAQESLSVRVGFFVFGI